jgi:hypothetical protein
MLLESNISRRLLADKTLGDSNRITASTPYEVLEETKSFLVKQERLLTSQAKQSLEIEKTEKERIAGEFNDQTTNIRNIIETLSMRGRKIVVGLLFFATIIFYAFAEFYEPKPMAVKIIGYLVSVASLVSGISAVAFGEKVEIYVRTRLTRLLLKK